MRLIAVVILLFSVFGGLCASETTPNASPEVFTVVIDPGHGGKDSGCVGAKAKEKDIVLAVGKLLREKIQEKYGKKVNVVMTRSTDNFVTLQKRAEIANSAKGNLYISIHVNSVAKKTRGRAKLKGSSVYTCGLHRSSDNLQVAMRENAVMELEPDYTARYQGFDPNSSESYIMFELSQNHHQKQSIQFARLSEDMLVSEASRSNGGVRQAGFWVLWATAMPSVLVELDFICNPTQEQFLSSKQGQEKCADALFKAFKKYYETSQ